MDELERRVRAARPLSGHRDLPLSDRAKRELADLLLAGTSRKPPRRMKRARPHVLVLTVMAIIMAVTVSTIGIASLLFPQPAFAATPEMLKVTPIHESVAEVLDPIADRLEAEPSRPAATAFTITVQAWTLDIHDNGKSLSSAIVPQDYKITVDSDGSRHQRITSAGPRTSLGAPAPSDSGPTAGHLLSEEAWKPGEYTPLYPGPAPTDSSKYEAYFNTVVQSDTSLSAATVLNEVNSLLLEQKLSSHQQGALLQYLASLPDLKLAGRVTDRLGRPGVALAATDPNRREYESLIVISPADGRILTTEAIYTGHDRTDIPSPAVVHYYAWK